MSIDQTVLILNSETPPGKAAIKAAQQRGYNVLEVARSKGKDVSNSFPHGSFDLQRVQEYENKLQSDGLQIDILITCPATVPAAMDDSFFQPFEEMEIEEWNNIITENLTVPMLFCKVFGHRMRRKGCGRIIQLVSNVAIDPHDPRHFLYVREDGEPGGASAAYSCAMAGVLALTRHLAADHQDSGVLINSLVFGPLVGAEPEALSDSYIQRVPLGRMMTLEDLSNALDLLLSPNSNYITGQSIVVEGGVSIW